MDYLLAKYKLLKLIQDEVEIRIDQLIQTKDVKTVPYLILKKAPVGSQLILPPL